MKSELYDIAQYALDELKKGGADGAEVWLGRNQMDELNYESGEFSLFRTTFGANLGIRALVETRKGSSSGNGLDRESVDKAIADALAAAKSSEKDDAEYIAESLGERDFSEPNAEADLDIMYERMTELLEGTKQEFPKVDYGNIVTRFNKTPGKLYANSNGSRVFQTSNSYHVSTLVSARDGENVSSMNGFGYLAKALDTPVMARDNVLRTLSEMEAQLNTRSVDGKFVGKLLVAPGCIWDFVFQALNLAVTDSVLITGVSPWKDKLGQTIADSKLSVAYMPLDDRFTGKQWLTNGYLSENMDVIKNGRLENFALSQYGAKKTGLPRAKSTGGNTIVTAGDTPYAQMLASIDRGLLINRFSGGMPAQNGDFSGVAKNSFLIENGKIVGAVSETMVSGNLYQMLNNIIAISRETDHSGSNILPFICFDGVTVSGK